MKITVCQLHDARDAFAKDWDELLDHVKVEQSELVLLPEMPFFQWFPVSRAFDAGVWRATGRAIRGVKISHQNANSLVNENR